MKKFKLYFGSYIKIENDIWFSAINCDGIYRYNIDRKIAEQISEQITYGEDIYYQGMCLYQNSLIFLPYDADKIYIYDMNSKSIKQIKLLHTENNAGGNENFGACVVYHDAVYVIGMAFPGIIKVDLKSYKIEIIFKVSNELHDYKGLYFGNPVIVKENLLYVPCAYENTLLICNMDQDIVSQVKIGNESNRYSGVVNIGEDFYFLDINTHKVIHWKEGDICREINLNFQKDFISVLLCASEKYIWIISTLPGEIYQINSSNDEVQYISLEQKFNIAYVETQEDELFFLDAYSCSWYHVSTDGNVTNLHIYIEDSRTIREVWEEMEQSYFDECLNFPIQYLFYQLYQKNVDLKDNTKKKQSLGKEIWCELKEELGYGKIGIN